MRLIPRTQKRVAVSPCKEQNAFLMRRIGLNDAYIRKNKVNFALDAEESPTDKQRLTSAGTGGVAFKRFS